MSADSEENRALSSRDTLRQLFKNGSSLSQDDFAELIRSVLNKRDDQFHGNWREGVTYRTGDVVVYDKDLPDPSPHERTLWIFKADANGESREKCSHEPPNVSDDWEQLSVKGDDEDWIMVADRTAGFTMHANPDVALIGIGTEEPRDPLEITSEAGSFRFNLSVNPALGIVNARPQQVNDPRRNFLVLGADNDAAVFVTNSPEGFAFRSGEPDTDDTEVNLNQGEVLMQLIPERGGQLGIGREPLYDLDISGFAHGFGYYVATDHQNVGDEKDLENTLDVVCKLKPIIFKWKPDACREIADGGIVPNHFGLLAHQVQEYLPEVVKTVGLKKSVAYHELVPVLIAALKELKEDNEATVDALTQRIEQLTQRIDQLEQRL